ncbi:MAG: hypothetical protein HY904_19645 [Deltaproteobacteria bacterium]|nr:hypothetical protein [Deltaproteobacteria bacterium]
MSEHRYYEFCALDRPLTTREQAALRRASTRATITATHFTNVYDYGDFRGNTDAWMAKYFDAHLHTASWGTHRFMLRVPADTVDARSLRPYCRGPSLRAARAVRCPGW